MPIRQFLDGFPDTGEPLGGERDQHQVGLASADRRRHLSLATTNWIIMQTNSATER
jgi:hypothetical protein